MALLVSHLVLSGPNNEVEFSATSFSMSLSLHRKFKYYRAMQAEGVIEGKEVKFFIIQCIERKKKGTHQPFLLALKDSESPQAAILYLGLPWASFSPILNTEQFDSILPSFSLLIHACAPSCMHAQACVTIHTHLHTHICLLILHCT